MVACVPDLDFSRPDAASADGSTNDAAENPSDSSVIDDGARVLDAAPIDGPVIDAAPNDGHLPDSSIEPCAMGAPRLAAEDWLSEEVRSPDVGLSYGGPTAVAVQEGDIHLLYDVRSSRTLEHTWFDASMPSRGWHTEIVGDAPGGSASYDGASIAVGSEGRLHMSARTTTHELWYGAWSLDQGWTTQQLPYSARSGTAMVVDSAGVPHLVFNAPAVTHAALDERGEWQSEVVEGLVQLSPAAALALGDDERLHVSIVDIQSSMLRYRSRSLTPGGSWSGSVVDDRFSTTGSSAIAVDADGVPHVAYDDSDGLQYATLVGRRWEVASIGLGSREGRTASIAIGPDGAVHIAHQEAANGSLRHAYLAPGADRWVHTEVDATGGSHSSIVITPEYQVYISYRGDRGGVRLASARYVCPTMSDRGP